MRAIVVGAGPNGLTAAARLAHEGWRVDIYEQADQAGGAASSTSEIFGNRTIVDLGAAGHPFGIASPAFRTLNLEAHGLQWAHAEYELAHPLHHNETGLLTRSLDATASRLGKDSVAWRRLHRGTVQHIDEHLDNVLAPLLRVPAHPIRMAQFGVTGVLPASALGNTFFRSDTAKALLAGSATHAITAPTRPLTGAFGLLFGALGMTRGWPVARGGTGAITDALVSVLEQYDADIHTGVLVDDLRALPKANAVVLNLTPRQILKLRGVELQSRKFRQLRGWKYGPGTYKVDFLLSEPVPWTDPRVGQAGTVHVGGTVEDIAHAEYEVTAGRMPQRPFVMVCQQYVADPSRGLVLWTYAHVPHGYQEPTPGQISAAIIAQIERYAPGFGDVIVAKHEAGPADLETWNPNLIGGDIAGGAMSGWQSLLRPGLGLTPHRIGTGVYVASGSSAPGAGVHGMPGWWAAETVIDDARTRFGFRR